MDLNDQHKENIKYYEGILIKRWYTKQNNLIIRTKDTTYLKQIHGIKIANKCTPSELNFLVPRRRKRTIELCSDIFEGAKIKIKLIEESRSKKFAVSEVFLT